MTSAKLLLLCINFNLLTNGRLSRFMNQNRNPTSSFVCQCRMGHLPDTSNCGLRMRRECRERFPRHLGSAIPTCITARASRTCRDACRDRQLAVSFEDGGRENTWGCWWCVVTCKFKVFNNVQHFSWFCCMRYRDATGPRITNRDALLQRWPNL